MCVGLSNPNGSVVPFLSPYTPLHGNAVRPNVDDKRDESRSSVFAKETKNDEGEITRNNEERKEAKYVETLKRFLKA